MAENKQQAIVNASKWILFWVTTYLHLFFI